VAFALVVLFCTQTEGLVSRLNLTATGPEVSRIALGTLHLMEVKTPENTLNLIETALSLGITTFDFSDVYGGFEGCLKLFGSALSMKPQLRDKMQIIAKMNVLNGYDSSRAHLEQILSDYLKILATDYVDLVLLHRQDYLMDVTEVSQLFYEWKRSKKVRYVGTSNHDQNSFDNLNSRISLATNEIEASVWAPETINPVGSGNISGDKYFTNNGLVDFHYKKNISVLAWGPLGGNPYGGTNRLFGLSGPRQSSIQSALQQIGNQLGDENDVVALAWLLRHPAKIVPIIGTTNPERMMNQTRAEQVAQKNDKCTMVHDRKGCWCTITVKSIVVLELGLG